MFKYHCLNPISAVGMNKLDENYVKTENADEGRWHPAPADGREGGRPSQRSPGGGRETAR